MIDQDARYGEWLKHHLGVICPESPISVLPLSEFERWSEELSGRDCDVLMLATSFGSSPEDPQAQGLELLRRLRDKPHFPAVIAVAEEGNELTAVRAMQLGAVDYLPKRLLTPERLRTSVRLALRMIEKRVARRLASLAYTGETDAKAAATDARSINVDVKSSTGARASLAAHVASLAAAAAVPTGGATAEQKSLRDDESSTNIRAPARTDDRKGPGAAVQADPGANGPAREANTDAQPTSGPATKQAPESATPVPAARAPGGEFMPADFIPGYTIHATIGESEKAAVYVATSAALRQNVAVKVSKTLRDEVAGRQFLEREYTAIVAIRDPSVVQIHDYGIHAGYEYLVMEYLPSGDLKARMQQSLTEQDAVHYVKQIAGALQVVHHAGLVHRDLKPPNVMLRENG
ncbi:MAG: protein kinase, partial [Acetobacteraceae bacterium]|nr:protein kinase [Acetobacteraceae bacterium]